MPKKKSQPRKPDPSVLSINICDSIIRDERTKKVSLIGLFNSIFAPTFPVRHPVMHVYIALTNGHGLYKLNVRLTRAEDNVPIVSMEGPIEFPDPLTVVELNIEWKGVEFNKPGEYVVEVLSDTALIGSRKFYVIPAGTLPPTKGTEG